jgi:RNA polymerase sigma factor for flagellar operon FliA
MNARCALRANPVTKCDRICASLTVWQCGATLAPESRQLRSHINDGLQIVERTASGMHRRLGRRVPLDDLISSGHEGLATALRRFEPDRGVPFRLWAKIHISAAIIDDLRRAGAIRRKDAATPGEAFAFVAFTDDLETPAPSPEKQLEHAQLHAIARAALAQLPDMERKLVEGQAVGRAFSALASSLRVSPSWACRMHGKALARLRRSVRAGVRPGGERRLFDAA